MSTHELHFKQRVYEIVASIPKGRVMTYGDIAAVAGQASAARIVGGLAHFGPTNLPWHRVVNRFGGLASGYPGGRATHREHLETECIEVGDDYIIIGFQEKRWNPLKPHLF